MFMIGADRSPPPLISRLPTVCSTVPVRMPLPCDISVQTVVQFQCTFWAVFWHEFSSFRHSQNLYLNQDDNLISQMFQEWWWWQTVTNRKLPVRATWLSPEETKSADVGGGEHPSVRGRTGRQMLAGAPPPPRLDNCDKCHTPCDQLWCPRV